MVVIVNYIITTVFVKNVLLLIGFPKKLKLMAFSIDQLLCSSLLGSQHLWLMQKKSD